MIGHDREKRRRWVSCCGSLILLTAAWRPEAAAKKPTVIAVIVNHKSPVSKLTRAELKNLFLKQRQSWPGGKQVVVLNARAKSKLREAFERKLLGMAPRDVGAYWVRQRVTGRTTPPRQISSSALARRLVKALPGAIAYVELSQVDASVKLVAIDGVSPTDAKYRYSF